MKRPNAHVNGADLDNRRTGRTIVLSGVLLILATGCDPHFSHGNSRNSNGLNGLLADGGSCTKDPQVIKNVMLAPPICNATAPCPCGTFCSSQTGGNCIADCVDNSWC